MNKDMFEKQQEELIGLDRKSRESAWDDTLSPTKAPAMMKVT